MHRINNALNRYRGQIGQNNAGAAPPQAESQQPPAHEVQPNHPPSSRHVPAWLRSALPSRILPFSSVLLLNHIAKEMHSAGCQRSLIDQFKRSWGILGSPHPNSLYARNLLADLQAHGYSPEHVQSVVDRMEMLERWTKASLKRQEVGDMTRLQKLDLHFKGLRTLPPEVGQWTAMQKLLLYDNQLETLPAEVGQWTAMGWLNLSENQLRTLPAEVRQWTAMGWLKLEHNQLETLPAEVGQWKSMQKLELGSNQLRTLPAEVGQWTAMQELYLEVNQLRTLPAEVGQWTAMQMLGLSSNELSTLPAEVGKWTAMQVLNLNYNQLRTLPAEIGQWTAMQELWLAACRTFTSKGAGAAGKMDANNKLAPARPG